MKSKVKLSLLSTMLTLAMYVLVGFAIVKSWDDMTKLLIIALVLLGVILFGLFYSPLTIEATDKSLIIQRFLKNKTIHYTEISDVDRCFPSLGGLRLCGSGGFMGYWGYFHDIVIGAYFGYFGNFNQCILVKLKNDRQYVISCNEPDEMISVLKSRLEK